MLSIRFEDLDLRDDNDDGDGGSSTDSQESQVTVVAPPRITPVNIEADDIQLWIWWDAVPYEYDATLGLSLIHISEPTRPY